MAKSAPEATIAWAMTSPKPLAPPVTTTVLPDSENEGSVSLTASSLDAFLLAMS
jgi:hypothetical protein